MDVGTTDDCLTWTVDRRELSKIGAVGNCTQMESINITRGSEAARVTTTYGKKCRASFRADGKYRYNQERHEMG